MLYDRPMLEALMAVGRRYWQRNLLASTRISMTLLMRAKKGASGNAATNSVTKPNCDTATPTELH